MPTSPEMQRHVSDFKLFVVSFAQDMEAFERARNYCGHVVKAVEAITLLKAAYLRELNRAAEKFVVNFRFEE